MQHRDVIQFWFGELKEADWWGGSPELDQRIRDRFSATHAAVAAGETFGWRTTAEGRLAEVIVLDQFSRNMFRGSGRAFAYDGMALVLAQEAVAQHADEQLVGPKRTFLYTPYIHSESLVVQSEGLRLYTPVADERTLGFVRMHIDVLKRFGRFPKRNAVLGRESTADELVHIQTSKTPV